MSHRLLLALAVALVAPACATQVDAPVVQASSEASPGGRIVELGADGSTAPACLRINIGQTVEFRNLAPDVPVNVTSLSDPPELFSPNLVAPYNRGEADGQSFSFWRHTFDRGGVFEYYDTNSGDPGKKVTDAYYGTVTFVGISDSVQTGVVCVRPPGGPECDGVCCSKQSDCPDSQCCDLTFKRCVLASSSNTQLCVGEKPAFREFECFDDSDCETGSCKQPEHLCSSDG